MISSSVSERIFRESRLIFELIEELKIAEALVILFYHHKQNLVFWCDLKSELMRSSHTCRQISVVATLVSASSQNSLSESCVLVPGLLNFLERHQ